MIPRRSRSATSSLRAISVVAAPSIADPSPLPRAQYDGKEYEALPVEYAVSLSCCASTYLEISVEMPDKFGTRIRYSFRFTAQGCVSMRAARTAVHSLRYWSSGMWRLDSRNRPVAKRAPRMPLIPSAASTAQRCLFGVSPHAAISIFDKT